MNGTSMQDAFDAVERGVERAEQWKPSDQDSLRSGRVETWKLIVPRDRPDEPVWLLEARDREGSLWSKFVSEVALQAKLIGRKLETKEELELARPETFKAAVGTFIAVKFEGKFPHPKQPGAKVTRWVVSVLVPETVEDDGQASAEPSQPAPDDAKIPF